MLLLAVTRPASGNVDLGATSASRENQHNCDDQPNHGTTACRFVGFWGGTGGDAVLDGSDSSDSSTEVTW